MVVVGLLGYAAWRFTDGIDEETFRNAWRFLKPRRGYTSSGMNLRNAPISERDDCAILEEEI